MNPSVIDDDVAGGSMAFLAVPRSMARATSQESFASNASIFSLSSLISETVANHHHGHRAVSWLDPNDMVGDDGPDMIKYREDVLERMLETSALTFTKLSFSGNCNYRKTIREQASTAVSSRNESRTSMKNARCDVSPSMVSERTASDEDLLMACSKPQSDNHRCGQTLFKSFSTSDILSIADLSMDPLKRCVSQAWLPSGYVLMLQCRRQHLEVFQRRHGVLGTAATADSLSQQQQDIDFATGGGMIGNDDSSLLGAATDLGCVTPEGDSGFKLERVLSSTLGGGTPTAGDDEPPSQLRATAVGDRLTDGRRGKQPGAVAFVRRLRLSKAIGKRLRNDLIRRLSRNNNLQGEGGSGGDEPGVDLERDKGRPVTKRERNFMIFHWLQSFDEEQLDQQI